MWATDLAVEACAEIENVEGIIKKESCENGITITDINIETEAAAEKVGKPIGRYLTLDVGDIALGLSETDGVAKIIAKVIKDLLKNRRRVLVIGVGNTEITPDALGPKTADGVLATRHLSEDFMKSTGLLFNSVAVLSPGVLGRTGMESAEVIRAVCNTVKPEAVIAVDALAASDVGRLGTTVQISNTGISPGSGVGNRRRELSQKTLGIPVIGVGIPTVTDSGNLGGESGFLVTIRDIDLLISRASELMSHSINFALQPQIEDDILLSLV